ncbi:hypothetical protein [Haloferula sp. A504]|uniref:hypothetical protein n=1 Tax=Haloferula sp. A504 TaxID=3373601 RepID=UPI0031C699B9|nr:hypothetical protein [Verrucomicrobiaceae bacterium E54]
MKPAVAISAIVIAVLATVVIEETRIKKLQDEITGLRALPPRVPDKAPPLVVEPAEGEDPVEPAIEPEVEPTAPPPVPGLRTVPENYPAPEEDRIREIALSPYSHLHYALNLTNRERAYFEDLMASRRLEKQQLAGQWIDALPEDRLSIGQSMEDIDSMTQDRIRTFLGNEDDFETYVAYDLMQPERELLSQIAPVMDQPVETAEGVTEPGVVLELEKELKLIEAMHRARKAAGGIDWNSLQGMKAMAEPDALERFKEEWTKTGEILATEIGTFLDETEARRFLAAREQVMATQVETLETAIEAVQ